MSCNAKKDPKGTWRIQYRWIDWTGTKKKSQKRGFKTKKEAEEWYAHFMLQQSSDPTMTLADFWEIYKADMEKRLRKATMKQKEYVMNDKVLPYFGKTPINEITAPMIRKWQGEMMEKGFKPTYLKTIHNQLSAILNYAVNFYDLRSNPCRKAGSMRHWNEAKIKEFAEVKGGKRLPKGKQLIKEQNSHPYIRIRDLGKSKYLQLTSEYEYVDDETQQSIARYIVNEGDILISVVGTIGLIGIVGATLDKANQTENCDKIINIKGLIPEYLYYYLVSDFGQEEIRKGTVGAVQPKLPLKNVQDISVRYPSMEEQEKIVAILSSIDEKIAINEKINNNLAA